MADAEPRLIAYRLDRPPPCIRPASVRRDWMDASPQGFAYRCLPLTIANGHGWEIPGDTDFEAWWNGGDQPGDIVLRTRQRGRMVPVSHFGAGVLTFHIDVLLRTEPGTGLWVSGPPNSPKDGIAPLSGVVETDWAPMTFTMNWRFTRPHQVVRFAVGEPVCFFFPLPRGIVPDTRPELRDLAEAPELQAAHADWCAARASFNSALKQPGSTARQQGWQRDYHRGRGAPEGADHRTKLQARPFPGMAEASATEPPATA
jgi:hypothetical protein